MMQVESKSGAAVFYRVGSLATLRKEGRLGATVDRRKIAVFLVDGSVIAVSGSCPHNRGPLVNGELQGRTLMCPWHGYTFDLHTGACEEDPALTLERFEVKVEGDDILVRL